MKGSMLRLSAAALAGVLFAAATAQADMMTKVGPGEGEVDIVAWPGYIERGANDKNYDWVTDFEKQTGCKVNAKTAGTSDEMVSLMNGGGFDLVTASGDATRRLIAGKTVQEVNIDLIPSFGFELWDTSWLLPQDSMIGRALHALVGYSDRPMGCSSPPI